MLAVMRALEEWRHHLQGALHPIEIHTDHKNLEYFMTARKLNRRQARWSLELANFDFTLIHKPGRMIERIHEEKEVERAVKRRLLLKEKDWREEEGLILWQDHVYVPPDCDLRKEIIHLHHNTRESGHPGRYK